MPTDEKLSPPDHECAQADLISHISHRLEQLYEAMVGTLNSPGWRTTQQNLAESIAKLNASMDRHQATLYGNGKPGLTQRTTDLEHAHQTVSRLAWLAVGAAITSIVVLIFRALPAILHHL